MSRTPIPACVLVLAVCFTSAGAQTSPTIKQLFAFPCTVRNITAHEQVTDCPSGTGINPLIQSADGNFYGTASQGGSGTGAAGSVFKLTPAGQMTALHTFTADSNGNYPNGANPGGLVEGNDGFLYGSTANGGSHGSGVVFKVSKTGTFQVIYNPGLGGTSNLTLADDGNFYGCGAGDLNIGTGGTLFRLSPQGSYALLHTFNVATEGLQCLGLTLGLDGNIYGTMSGGSVRITSLFRLTTAGQFSILQLVHYGQFTVTSPVQSANGQLYAGLDFVENGGPFIPGLLADNLSGTNFEQIPLAYGVQQWLRELLEDSKGNFWGTSPNIGATGAIVSFAHNGAPLKQINFGGFGLLQAANGTFLGVAGGGSVPEGEVGGGLVFTLNVGLPAPKPLFVRSSQSGGAVGAQVMIHGRNFVGTTRVAFNGVSATFRVLNAGNILATAPPGATTGTIEVTNAGGSALSRNSFAVQ